jgi:hypothetical protein
LIAETFLPREFNITPVGGLGRPPPPIAAVLGLLDPNIMNAEDPRDIFLLELLRPLTLLRFGFPLDIPLYSLAAALSRDYK